ncbi:hypothetical protein VAA_00452 [Vibrio anguillarum 775]|nr:hypothetical protein VAA_00452 [Vibrio anguillarum 775]AGU58708.1 hypothetical protein N175_00540 [Vibrio anguillarum M3]
MKRIKNRDLTISVFLFLITLSDQIFSALIVDNSVTKLFVSCHQVG